LSLLCAPDLLAGKNANGALIVHTVDSFYLPYHCVGYPENYCGEMDGCFDDPTSCELANTEARGTYHFMGDVVWVFAAFPEGADPGVSRIDFGIDHNLPFSGYIPIGWPCGPEGTYQVPDSGWPDDPEHAGTSVVFGEPVVGNRFFVFYYFVIYGEPGHYFGTSIKPTAGNAVFVSDEIPGIEDEIHHFGQVRWFEPGFNQCPNDATSGLDGGDPPELEHVSWGRIRGRYH
jgi:hypothetical protein